MTTTQTRQIFEFLQTKSGQSFDSDAIARCLGLNPHSVSARLSEMVQHDIVERIGASDGRKRYWVAEGAVLPPEPLVRQNPGKKSKPSKPTGLVFSQDEWRRGYRDGFADGLRAAGGSA